ncbi:uncharacterized protein HKW66_Vig0039540 [Vigna angularis]|uniref:Uncharacterized protein n=1 Tax=Phaseolus angularis TaxID=3914 RepID=A0A8T0LC21_PHAAN|nr:uncharacterized protein HKW66_Vig0039540 [Vigna angularis]
MLVGNALSNVVIEVDGVFGVGNIVPDIQFLFPPFRRPIFSMDIREQALEGVQNESVGTLSQVIEEQTTWDEMYDDFLADLCNDNDILPLTDETFETLFQIDEPILLDYFSSEALKEVEEGESRQVAIDTPAHNVSKATSSMIQLTPNSSERANISISPGIVVVSDTSTPTGEGPSKVLAQELGGNMGVANPIINSRNCSNSTLLLPQNNPNFWVAKSDSWNHPSARLGTMDPPGFNASFRNPMFPNVTGSSITRFPSPRFPVLPYGGSSSNIHQQHPRSLPLQTNGMNAPGASAMVHRFNNHGIFCPRPPSLSDFDTMVSAWKVI